MKEIVTFIKSKTFLKHLAIAVVSIVLFFIILFKFIGVYADFKETIAVPDFTNVKIQDIENFVKDKDVRFQVIDSVYDIKSPRGIVIRQDPEAGNQVKHNRTIYLYVTSILPPSVEMPKLVDRSLRQAVAMIESFGLKLGRTKYVPDQCANCVLEQMYKGKKIEAGTKIEKGSVIDLIIGKGLSDEEVPIPYLIGLTRKEALQKLTESSLNEGAITFDSKDSLNSRVYRQIPGFSKDGMVNMGSSVDLFFTRDKGMIPETPDTNRTKVDEENK